MTRHDLMVRVALDPEEWREVRSAAALDGKPLRAWLADVIRAALEQRENGKT